MSSASIKDTLSRHTYVICALLVIGVFYLINPRFLSLYSVQNMALEAAPLLLMATGISFVLFTGCIDLSTGAVASCVCVLTGTYVAGVGNGIIPLMLFIGLFAGFVNGIIVTKLKVPSFIVTLCAQSVWKCAALVQSGGGSKNIPAASRGVVLWASRQFLSLPVLCWVSFAVMLVFFFVQQKTTVGKSIFAAGANEKAARMAGVDTDGAKIWAFVFSGLGSALSGVLYAYKLKSSVPNIGDPLNLMAISAVALGGTLLSGGKGSVLRTLVGVITVIAISSGMNMAGVDAFWKNITYGVVLILAIIVNSEKGLRDLIVK
ncbi:MAG: ABC transporter permease [Synergistaceae bacterium]|jgi:ribose/xylose/arabinose/galactoside ABC-type transport system permease subunit|nr:ABC transporter permease [Synergistaceae bacterium]